MLEHELGGRTCWCNPRIVISCDECDGDSSCWKCDGLGLIDVPVDYPREVIIIHPDDDVEITGVE